MTYILDNDFAAAPAPALSKAARGAMAIARNTLSATGSLLAAMPRAIGQAFAMAYVDPLAGRGARPFMKNPDDY